MTFLVSLTEHVKQAITTLEADLKINYHVNPFHQDMWMPGLLLAIFLNKTNSYNGILWVGCPC